MEAYINVFPDDNSGFQRIVVHAGVIVVSEASHGVANRGSGRCEIFLYQFYGIFAGLATIEADGWPLGVARGSRR